MYQHIEGNQQSIIRSSDVRASQPGLATFGGAMQAQGNNMSVVPGGNPDDGNNMSTLNFPNYNPKSNIKIDVMDNI